MQYRYTHSPQKDTHLHSQIFTMKSHYLFQHFIIVAALYIISPMKKDTATNVFLTPQSITLHKCCRTVFQQSVKEITNSTLRNARAHLDTRTKRRRLKTHLPHFYFLRKKYPYVFRIIIFPATAAPHVLQKIICVSVMCFNFLCFWSVLLYAFQEEIRLPATAFLQEAARHFKFYSFSWVTMTLF